MFKKCIFFIVFSLGLVACSPTSLDESTGEYIDSSAITAKVKARLIDGLGSEALAIKVKTFRDTVQLSGFVNHLSTKNKAGTIADNTVGVKAVQNDLIVKQIPVSTGKQRAWSS